MFVVVRQQTWDTLFMSGIQRKKLSSFRANSRRFRVLEEISAGDMFVGFLSSSASSRLMYTVARKRAHDRYLNKRIIAELEKEGCITRSSKNGEVYFLATKHGKKLLHDSYTETIGAAQRPKLWDKKWRVLIYDFPEHERSRRNSLRYILAKSGFLKIQKSVWIFPYAAPLLSALIAQDSVINSCTIFMETINISHESEHLKHFNLR